MITIIETVFPFSSYMHYNCDVIKLSEGIKPFREKHLFSELVCNVKGQGVLKHVEMLITLTPCTRLEAWKKDTLGLLGWFGFGFRT